jgi:MFS transporter, FSR family, fosmidomycin resistance protein
VQTGPFGDTEQDNLIKECRLKFLSRDIRTVTLANSCGIHAIQDGLYATIYVLLPVLAPIFGLTLFQVGFIRAAYSSAMVLFQLPSGMLSERFGERILLVFGLSCAGAAFLFLAFAPGAAIVALALILAGLGGAFHHAPSSSIIVRAFPDAGRRAALGIYNAAGDVGKLTFSGIFTLAIGLGVAWNHTVVGFGTLSVLAAGIVLIVLRRWKVGGPPQKSSKSKSTADKIGWGIRDRIGFMTLGLIVFLDLAVQSGFLTFVAFLMSEKEVPTGLAALAVVLTLTGGTFGKFGCGFLAERMGAKASLILVQCLTAAGILAVVVSPTLVAFALLPLLGMVLQGSSSVTYGTITDLVHRDRQSRGFAAIYSISSAAGIVGPIVFGIIGDRFGIIPAMLAITLTVLASLPLIALLRIPSADIDPVQ